MEVAPPPKNMGSRCVQSTISFINNNKKNHIHPNHHSFLKNCSTCTALHHIHQHLDKETVQQYFLISAMKAYILTYFSKSRFSSY